MSIPHSIFPLGDHALTIQFGNTIDKTINHHCHSIASLLQQEQIPGIKNIIPCYTTVSVVYDPLAVLQASHITSPYNFLKAKLEELIGRFSPSAQDKQRTIRLPACFDRSFAPDLENMAAAKGLGSMDIIKAFLSRNYQVYMIGFLPGFPYMGKVDDRIATPRKQTPHARVEAGSIGIAANQTGIYPLASPGGWNIIGRTPVRLFDKHSAEPCLLKPGDEIVFEEISIDAFHQQNQNN